MAIPLSIQIYFDVIARHSLPKGSAVPVVPWTDDLIPLLEAEEESTPKVRQISIAGLAACNHTLHCLC